MRSKRRAVIKEMAVLLSAVCSTVALFGDVASTGNLSMALNGAGIPQLIALAALVCVYRRIWIRGICAPVRTGESGQGHA